MVYHSHWDLICNTLYRGVLYSDPFQFIPTVVAPYFGCEGEPYTILRAWSYIWFIFIHNSVITFLCNITLYCTVSNVSNDKMCQADELYSAGLSMDNGDIRDL